MNLSQLKPPAGQQKRQQRVGRGMGSHRGKTAGRGHKGARSISGYSMMRGFEGGQMPLHRRLPKRGFSNAPFKKHFAILNVGRLDKLAGDSFDPASLKASGIVKRLQDGLRILGTGELTRKITVKAHHFSPEAEKKILAAGGSVEKIVVAIAPVGKAAAAAAKPAKPARPAAAAKTAPAAAPAPAAPAAKAPKAPRKKA
jgi:large subunit ribosomal protein L15